MHLGDLLEPLRSVDEPHSLYRTERLGDGRLLLTLDGRRIGASFETQAIANLLLWSVNQEVAARTSESVLVHGGAVASDGQAVVLPGTSGSGKSTLTAAMVMAGFDYLTDEAVAFSLSSGSINSYHRPISLKTGSWSVLPHARPATPPEDPPYTTDIWHVLPQSLRAHSLVDAAQPVLIVLPSYQRGAPPQLSEISPGEAAAALALNSFNLSRLGQHGLDRLAQVARTAPAFRLRHADVSSAVSQICDLLDELQRR